MAKAYEITEFQKRSIGKKEFITKFGGQPDWIRKADWPLSEGWDDRKMAFICQIFLKKGMLGNDRDLMAYVFMTQPAFFDDDFFDPDIAEWEGGENAVILQAFRGEEQPVAGEEGPAMFDEDDAHYEYIPVLKEMTESDYISAEAYHQLDDAQQSEYFNEIDKDKLCGTPAFFTRDEWPEGDWKLLLQLHCNFQPFVLRAGAMPTMFVFVSGDFKEGGVLIQDS